MNISLTEKVFAVIWSIGLIYLPFIASIYIHYRSLLHTYYVKHTPISNIHLSLSLSRTSGQYQDYQLRIKMNDHNLFFEAFLKLSMNVQR